jgi:hypothetical protein
MARSRCWARVHARGSSRSARSPARPWFARCARSSRRERRRRSSDPAAVVR